MASSGTKKRTGTTRKKQLPALPGGEEQPEENGLLYKRNNLRITD